MFNKIYTHCDFGIKPAAIAAITAAILSIPCIMFLPEQYGWENGLLENLQMLVLIILILREVNCGRTIFFPIPGEINEYYTWKQLKYGWLAHPLYGLYMAYVGVYFFIKKAYVDLYAFIRNIKFPVWNILLMLVGMSLGMYAEKVLDNCVFEECAELLFYISLIGIIRCYSGQRNFVRKTK